MKSKEEILKMTKEELSAYKQDKELDHDNSECFDCLDCSHCSDCLDCSDCSNCLDCSDCYNCRNAKGLKWAICNVQMTKEEYEAKMKELGVETK